MVGGPGLGVTPIPFVGREQKLAALLALLDEAQEGRGHVCLIGGEPGIGKSRLVDPLEAYYSHTPFPRRSLSSRQEVRERIRRLRGWDPPLR